MKQLILLAMAIFMSLNLYAAESVYTAKGAAIKGYDPVAYFTQDQAIKGSKEFSYEHKGAKWLFASAENLELFKNNPAEYTPQYNGYCAFAMGFYGKKVKIDPNIYTIKDGKLYLNYNKKIGNKFNDNIDQFIADGDVNWQKIISE